MPSVKPPQSSDPPVDYVEAEVMESFSRSAALITPPSTKMVSPHCKNALSPPTPIGASGSSNLMLSLSTHTCTPWTLRSDVTPMSPLTPFTPHPQRERANRQCPRNRTISPNAYSTDVTTHTHNTQDVVLSSLSTYEDDAKDSVCHSEYEDEGDEESLSIGTMLCAMSSTDEELFLVRKGYERRGVICDTLQGQLFLALKGGNKVAIKKTPFAMHQEGICIEDGVSIVVCCSLFVISIYPQFRILCFPGLDWSDLISRFVIC